MKRNIDLTENMIFLQGSKLDRDIDVQRKSSLSFSHKNKFPWIEWDVPNKGESDIDVGEQRYNLVTIGNKKDRAKIVYYKNLDSGDYCDCCGASLVEYPWDRKIGLCDRCTKDMHNFNRSNYLWIKE